MKTIARIFKTHVVRLTILPVLLLLTVQPAAAQQFSDYQRLTLQNNRPNVYVDVITLPGPDNTLQLTSIFRLNYNFLSFQKANAASGDKQFRNVSNLSIEVFKSPKKDLKPNEQVKMKGLESVGRATWQDTAYASNYEQTQAVDRALNGSMQVQVQPGHYTYFLKLNKAEGGGTQNSRTRNVHVFPYEQQKNGDVMLVKSTDDLNSPSRLQLVNMGNNVRYGENFYAFIHLPDYNAETKYTMHVTRVKPGDDEDDPVKPIEKMTEESITPEQIHSDMVPKLRHDENQLVLSLSEQENGHTYALLKVPNKAYPNAVYQLHVKAGDQKQPVAKRLFQSYWSDIPTGLLSLDVAIDLLRFIADKETIKKIDDGSDTKREEKFRAFWKKKDPTPDTQINELQKEYYERIDYAYREFSSDRAIGFNTDRGKVYINFGPPNDMKRTFPTDGPTKEIWTYDSRNFVFEATTGFGDFKLVTK